MGHFISFPVFFYIRFSYLGFRDNCVYLKTCPVSSKYWNFCFRVLWWPQFWPEQKITEVVSKWILTSYRKFSSSSTSRGAELDGDVQTPLPGPAWVAPSTGPARANCVRCALKPFFAIFETHYCSDLKMTWWRHTIAISQKTKVEFR